MGGRARKHYKPQGRALKALISVYAPPRKVRIIWNEDCSDELAAPHRAARAEVEPAATAASDRTGIAPAAAGTGASGETHSSGCNDARALHCQSEVAAAAAAAAAAANSCNSERPDQPDLEPAEPDIKRQRLDERRWRARQWVGSVLEALSDVFTAIWANFVESTDEFRISAQLHPGDAKPASNANLVSRVFSSERLVASRESYSVHLQLMQAFGGEAALMDWESHPAVNAYVAHLKSDPMIRECCLGLFSRLGQPQFEQVDQFVDTLRQVWFQPVLSNPDMARCGYHHVCIGDFFSRSGKLSGMHCWFKFLVEEERRRTRIRKWWSYEKDLHLVSMGFSMKHPTQDAWFAKPRSSFLIGVPIDFELLLFTVITMVNPNKDTAVQIRDFEPLVVVPRSLRKTGNVVTAYFRQSPEQQSD